MVLGWCWQGEMSEHGVETCSSVQFAHSPPFHSFSCMSPNHGTIVSIKSRIRIFFIRNNVKMGSKITLILPLSPTFQQVPAVTGKHSNILYVFVPLCKHSAHVAYWDRRSTYSLMFTSAGWRCACIHVYRQHKTQHKTLLTFSWPQYTTQLEWISYKGHMERLFCFPDCVCNFLKTSTGLVLSFSQ